MLDWKRYRKLTVTEMAPWTPGVNMAGVSVNADDERNGSPKDGDMIARDPNNRGDQWLVEKDYFEQNFEPVATDERVE